MTQSFDEWKECFGVSCSKYSSEGYTMEEAFKAGAQSKQAEIDELQKRIDDALRFTNNAHSDLNIGMLKMVEILKGTADE